MAADPTRTVNARLVFPATGKQQTLARVRVTLEDVSQADRAAVTVGSIDQPDVVIPADGLVLDLPVSPTVAADPRRRYVVRAHGSVAGADTFRAGDFLTTTALPVELARSETVEVPLHAIS